MSQEEYKKLTGQDVPAAAPAAAVNKPAAQVAEAKPAVAAASAAQADGAQELLTAVNQQGDAIRKLKADKADKATIDAAVAKLKALKVHQISSLSHHEY